MGQSQLAANLVRILGERDLTGAGLSKLAGRDRTTVDNIVSGKSRHPRHDTVRALADALHLSVEELLSPPITLLGDVQADGRVRRGKDKILPAGTLNLPSAAGGYAAIVFRGDAAGGFEDGDVLFYQQPTGTTTLAAAFNRICVVETSRGRVMLAKLTPGPAVGLVDLAPLSGRDRISGDRCRWAAPVRWFRRALNDPPAS